MASVLAERLGFAPDERVAIIHADDVGMCHAANDGAFEALAAGPATCGSVMVPCPWFPEAAQRARAIEDVDLGVHLTLNSEWEGYRWGPLLGRAEVGSLCAPDGGFWRNTAETGEHGRADHVEAELRAQVQTALDAGIDVTHLDAHMGTVFLPRFVSIYASLAREFELPVFLVRPEPGDIGGRPFELEPIVEALEGLAGDGWPVMDGFCSDSLHFSPGNGLEHNRARLRRLPVGVTYLICHPARGGEEIQAMTEGWHCREFERSFYGGDTGRQAVEAEGIRTVGMRTLRDLLRAG